MSKQHASVSQGRVCSDSCTSCGYTEIEVKDKTFYLTQLQYTDAGPGSPSADPVRPEAGIMKADDSQATTVFTVQPSFHHRHSTNPVS